MGPFKDFKEFSIVEVGLWLAAQGLGERAPKFLEEGVSGDLLSSLTADELQSDLGLSGPQARKVLAGIEFTRNLGAGTAALEENARLTQDNAGLSEQATVARARAVALREKNGALSRDNGGLRARVAALEAALAARDFGDSGGFASADAEEEDVERQLLDDPAARMCPRKRARIVERRTREQLAGRKIRVGFHHGHFNPLPASWKMPKRLTVLQLANLWLVGCEREHVPPLRKLSAVHLHHIDPKGKTRSRMRFVMGEMEYFAKLEHVWLERGCWDAAAVTKMWSAVWPHLDTYLRTVSGHKEMTVEERRQGQMPWRTCYNKLNQMGGKGRPSQLWEGREGGGEEGVSQL